MSAIAAIHPGFLEDICAHREDDTPRLIYADWLEDNGQSERAEFIRVQCELALGVGSGASLSRASSYEAGLESLRDDERELALRRREQELLAHWGERWATPVAKVFDLKQWGNAGATCGPGDPKAGIGWKFRRGFVAEVRAPLDPITHHLPLLVEVHPLEVVRTTNKHPVDRHGLIYWTFPHPGLYEDVPCCLPRWLFERLPKLPRECSEEEAALALSSTLLSWARDVEPCSCIYNREACSYCHGTGWAPKEGR